ncbi:alpha/beta fold hydrolase [Zavarzinia sp. CC-PAN008]|uniref:alpha/beta fold hydrolase n=1 Tax=Zavarzinia sp. CC-PAN008 TaxID=3243332 RepID=UPI003F747D88
MTDLIDLKTDAGLTFQAWNAGAADAPLVVLLHGFPQSRHTWRDQVPALAAAGYRALAPDQRGYSPGARPDPANLANYDFAHLVGDVIALIAAAGHGDRRFHLVGHDWGGQVAWGVADAHAARVASLTILSRPHPQSFIAAMKDDPEQANRSRHHKAFLSAETGGQLLADDAARLRSLLAHAKVPPQAVADYVGTLNSAPAMEAALAWYRANVGLRAAIGTITVPTLYLWGTADSTVGRMAAEGTAAHVSGPFRFVELDGVDHFITDEVAGRVTEELLAHVRANPV